MTDTGRQAAATAGREAAVFDRIEAFRRRRPRLLDEVVTLAHGAGGKASAALLDAVFLPAFADDADGAADRRRRARPCPSGERLAFSTDSFVVKPLRFPGGSIGAPGRARHGQRPGHDGRPAAWLSAAFVIEEGFPIDELREIVADMAEAAADGRRRRSSPATPRWSTGAPPTACTSPPPGVGVIPAGPRAVGRRRCAPATWCSCRARSATTAWR